MQESDRQIGKTYSNSSPGHLFFVWLHGCHRFSCCISKSCSFKANRNCSFDKLGSNLKINIGKHKHCSLVLDMVCSSAMEHAKNIKNYIVSIKNQKVMKNRKVLTFFLLKRRKIRTGRPPEAAGLCFLQRKCSFNVC